MRSDKQLVQRWLVASREDLLVARKIGVRHALRAMAIAYEAGLRTCLGLLNLDGQRVRDQPGHHRAAIEGAGAVLGEAFWPLLRRLDAARRLRNESLYGSPPSIPTRVREQLIGDVERLLSELERRLPRRSRSAG